MNNVLTPALLPPELKKFYETMPAGFSGLGLETSRGRHFGFQNPFSPPSQEAGYDWIQPGDADRPELVWRCRPCGQDLLVSLTVTNTTGKPLSVRRLVVWQECISPEPGAELPAFYQPGWQTWSQAGVACPPVQEPAPVKAVRLPGASGGRYSFPSVTGIQRGDQAQVWGFITAFRQTGLITLDPHTHVLEAAVDADDIRLDSGETLASEELLVGCAPTLSMALERYAARLAERMGAVSDPTREMWWCTWYERLAKIDAAFVLANLDWIQRHRSTLPVAGILIDQGHELNMGDWLDTDRVKFPGGLKPVIDAVHAAGLQFGLWLAPLFFSARSALYQAHPDWAVRDETGAPLVAKVLEGIEHFGLDTTRAEARAWLETMIEDALALGVDLFKFDYLYAGAMRGLRHDPKRTSLQAYRLGVETINAVLQRHPGVRTLGCGAPFAASAGLFSLMRTATDTVPYWPQPGDERYNRDGTQSGQRLTLQSLVSRSWMQDSLWSPDSDAFVLRSTGNQLTLPEVYTQAILYWLNERFMTIGDDLTALDPDRLRIYSWLYPALGPWVRVVGSDPQHIPDVFLYQPEGGGQLLALVNWAHEAREVTAGPLDRDYHLVDTLSGEYLGRLKPGSSLTRRLPAHGTQIIRLTEAAPHPQVIGANLHIAGGLAEIQAETWDESQGVLSVLFQSEGQHQGHVVVAVPPGYQLAPSYQLDSTGSEIRQGLLTLSLHLEHQHKFCLKLCFV